MAVLASGSYDRNAVVAATSYAQSITIPSGTNRRLLLICVAGRFTLDTQSTPTYNGTAMTFIGSSASSGASSASAVRTSAYEMVDPPVGTANFAVTNPGNTNDGTWWYLVIDGSTGSVSFAVIDSSAATTATPSAGVTSGQIGFVAGGSVSYSGGGVLSGTTQVGSIYYGTCAGYREGADPGLGTWSSNQASAVTVVAPMSAGGGASIVPLLNTYRRRRA